MERLHQIGRIAPLHASRIKRSRMGIGFEKLDRNWEIAPFLINLFIKGPNKLVIHSSPYDVQSLIR